MILRKPYAFLIKYFKLIHLIISMLVIFIITKTNNVLNFFKDYSNNNIIEVIPSQYINFIVYFTLILIIGLALTILILMRKKDKPLLFYVLTIIGYTILFAGFIYLEGVIGSLKYEILDRKSINFARDITRFMLIGQFLFIIPYIIRTLGFDIKKFDFKKDLQELEIEVTDNEEFELVSPIDTDKIQKVGRKKLRELKYYYIENKLFITIILSVLAVFIGYKTITTVASNIDIKYKEQDVIKLDNFYTLTINDSYIVTNDKNGKKISNVDKSFLIVKFTIKSNYNSTFILNTNKFILKLKNNEYIPNKTYYNYFTDYGIGYKNQKFSLNDNKTFILVYDIPEAYKKKSMKLEYNYRYDNSNNNAKMIKKIVKLKPEIIN